MKAVITGITGFLGGDLARELLSAGHTVYGIVRPGREVSLPDTENFRKIEHEAADMENCGEISEADVFFHYAWGGVNRGEINSDEVQKRNIEMSLSCVKAAARLGCRLFMDAGSLQEYGAINGPLREDAECRPTSSYGIAKTEFFNRAVPLCREYGVTYYHPRYFSIYGRGDHPWSLISTLLRELPAGKSVALGECTHLWNYTYIKDISRAVRMLAERGQNGGGDCEIINVCGSDTRVLKDFIAEVNELTGKKGGLDFGAFKAGRESVVNIDPDNSKCVSLTGGWQEEYSFARGIRETLGL